MISEKVVLAAMFHPHPSPLPSREKGTGMRVEAIDVIETIK
jgi:hypothetical protein